MKDVIDRFLWCWHGYAELFPANSCIEATRIFLECMPEEARVETVETRLVVLCDQLKLAYVGGSTEAERAQAFANKPADEIIDMHTPGRDDVGHVVAIVDGLWLVDLTVSQAAMPEKGLVIERTGLAVGPLPQPPEEGTEIVAGVTLDTGLNLDITWTLTGRRDFERTEAWEPSHLWPLIHRIRREILWTQAVEKAAKR